MQQQNFYSQGSTTGSNRTIMEPKRKEEFISQGPINIFDISILLLKHI